MLFRSFASESIAGPALSDDTGWNNVRFYSTIRLVDVDGDAKADVCARASDGLHCWRSSGTGFEEGMLGPAWSDTAGFGAPGVYETVRAARPMRRCVVDEACNGEDDDCDTMIDEGCPTDGDEGGGEGGSDGGTGEGGEGSEDGGATTGAADGTDTVDPGLPGGFGADGEGGCGCRADGRRDLPVAGFLSVVLLSLRRRRRRRTRGRTRRRHGAVTPAARLYPRRRCGGSSGSV